jgi:hypothetical protein
VCVPFARFDELPVALLPASHDDPRIAAGLEVIRQLDEQLKEAWIKVCTQQHYLTVVGCVVQAYAVAQCLRFMCHEGLQFGHLLAAREQAQIDAIWGVHAKAV